MDLKSRIQKLEIHPVMTRISMDTQVTQTLGQMLKNLPEPHRTAVQDWFKYPDRKHSYWIALISLYKLSLDCVITGKLLPPDGGLSVVEASLREYHRSCSATINHIGKADLN